MIPSSARKTFFCVDGHTCGNPVRMVAGGGPLLNGGSMSARRQDFIERYDWIRTALMFEPRGHDVMSGSILYPPCRQDCDIGVLYIEVSGCLPMCGHGTIGTVTFALEQGLVTPAEPGVLRLDTPAGLVLAQYQRSEGRDDERGICRECAPDQCSELSRRVRGQNRLPWTWRIGGRHRLWRQFLRYHRPATEFRGLGEPVG